MIPVKIIKKLNIRNGPGTSFESIATIPASGNTIDMDGETNGESHKGINVWFFKINDKNEKQYYWGGGIEKMNSMTVQNSDIDFQLFLNQNFDGTSLKSVINYNHQLNIKPELKSNSGSNVTVVIVDHPISSNIVAKNPIERPIPSNDPLFNFHANFIFGLIAGTQDIVGIANDVKIVSLPIYDEDGFPLENGIENALNYIKDSSDPMIINISNGFGTNYDSIIDKFSSNKIIVTCSGVNEELNSNTLRYPSSISKAISVAAIDSSFSLNNIKRKVDIALPNFNYVSYRKSGTYSFDRGDSFATAVVSSVIALLISSKSTEYNVDSIKSKLKSLLLSPSSVNAFTRFNLLNI